MTFKEWQAVITLVSEVLVVGWLVLNPVPDATVVAVATRLMWAIGVLIVFNIVVNIAVVIAISVARQREFKDDPADERDKSVIARSARNAQFVLSFAVVLTLLGLALGVDPVIGAYALFAALMLSGVADNVSKLIYYRTG
jgi:hypothetical protein